jgi:Rad3-related DNA helicase
MPNGSPFEQRDFVVCDEGHKVLEIVQSHFSPRISRNTHEVLVRLQANLNEIGFTDALINIDKLKELVEQILKEENKDSLLSYLKRVMAIIGKALSYRETVSKRAKELFGEHPVPKEWQNTFKGFDHCKDVHCKIEDYIEIVEKSGLDYMIKNPTSEDEVVFNCLDEHYLMKKHFFSRFGFVLMMTATMGSKKDFEKNLGIKKSFYHKIESTFDYSRSPINYYPSRRMSMKDMPNNFEWLVKKVNDILDAYPTESGIIHSGSYDLANKIYNRLNHKKKHRVMLYKGTGEKMDKLTEFMDKPGHVIMGPSLLEGLNLDGEKSRLQIFVKVPYPNLGDKYVSAKMKYSREWYVWKTCTAILQGIGRSVRSEEDWAVTYFLDGCLTDLLMGSEDNFPEEFINRINIQD